MLGGWKAKAEVAERNNERLSNSHLIGESRALDDETRNKGFRDVEKDRRRREEGRSKCDKVQQGWVVVADGIPLPIYNINFSYHNA